MKGVSFINRPLRPQGNFLWHSLMSSLGWAPKPVWAICSSDKTDDPAGIETRSLDRPARTIVTTALTPRWFLRGYSTKMTKNAIPSPPRDMYSATILHF